MTQEAVQITTTPPLPGLQLVQDLNKALQTLATDFSGATDPAAMAWPYSTWADTGAGTFKRRNAANSAWVIEGRLLRAHLPMYVQADVPTADIGPIYIIGKGPAEWVGAAYKPLISGIPGATFAEVDALTEDQGPAMVTDHGGAVYVWDSGSSKYAPLIASEIYAGALKIATTALALALDDDATSVSPKKLGEVLSANVLGMGQTWQNLTASRALGTTYTNTTGRTISVIVTAATAVQNPASIGAVVDGVLLATAVTAESNGSVWNSLNNSLAFNVPPESMYSVSNNTFTNTLTRWSELR